MNILLHQGPLIVNKARQVGITTTMACLAVYEAALGRNKVLVASNSEEASRHIVDEYCPGFEQVLVAYGLIESPVTDRKRLRQWSHGGEIRAFSSNPSTVRGYPANLVILDEFAHFTNEANLDRRMLEAIGPGVAQAGGRLIIVSTPRGMANEFFRIWSSPETPADSKLAIPYTLNPDLRVREETLPYGKRYWIEGFPKAFYEASFLQEFCNFFDPGTGTAIPTDAIWAALDSDDKEAWA
jgi:hypothetical protein